MQTGKKTTKTREYAKNLKAISKNLEQVVWEMIRDLRESEQRYRSLVEFAADAIITMDANRTITSWNQAAQQIFGFTEDEALGKKIDNLVTQKEVEQEAIQLSERVLRGESIRSFEAVRYSKTGEQKNVLLSATPILDAEGTVVEVSLMYKDITELKQAHEQLLQTEKQATLGIIAGSIGHELNNLVGGLLVHAKLLQQHYDKPERVKETVDVFLTNLEKVILHGKNLLSLSRPTKPRFEPLDLNSVLEDVTDTLVLSGVLKHHRVVKDLNPMTGYINGDRHLLEQVIRNLEINSAHAMQNGGTLTISTRLSEKGRHFEVAISDTGAGIPIEIQDKIFQPFFTTKGEGQGTGLGLPIVKDIIEKHRGYLKLTSQVGKGTTVTVGIPLAKPL